VRFWEGLPFNKHCKGEA